jgi:hypothetical protein
LAGEQEGAILATAKRNGIDPERVYARWSAKTMLGRRE